MPPRVEDRGFGACGAGNTEGTSGWRVSGGRRSQEVEGLGSGDLAAGFVETKAHLGLSFWGLRTVGTSSMGRSLLNAQVPRPPAQAGCTEPSGRRGHTTAGVSATAFQAGTLTQGRAITCHAEGNPQGRHGGSRKPGPPTAQQPGQPGPRTTSHGTRDTGHGTRLS